VGGFGLWTNRLRGNSSGEGWWQGALYPSATAQIRDYSALPRRTDPEPCSNELFFESRTGFSESPALRLSSPRDLRAFPTKVGDYWGEIGTNGHE
jgi:hypothetical protein